VFPGAGARCDALCDDAAASAPLSARAALWTLLNRAETRERTPRADAGAFGPCLTVLVERS
jgi:hypothetical protein